MKRNSIRIYNVDAFTSIPFRGNAAVVCIYKEELSKELMQRIARMYNYSSRKGAI
jgi:PhzF family phenazine biosynthesis protein